MRESSIVRFDEFGMALESCNCQIVDWARCSADSHTPILQQDEVESACGENEACPND